MDSEACADDASHEASSLARKKAAHDPSWAAQALQLCRVLGPGLMVCLADSDIGGLFTMAVAGAKTGYALISLQLALVPVLYVVQEMTVRLGICRRMGLVALAAEELGPSAANVLSAVMVILGVSAMISEFSGIAAVGEIWGLSAFWSCLLAVVFLVSVVFSADYAKVERAGLCLGGCLIVFIFTAIICHPSWSQVAVAAVHPSFREVPVSAKIGELVLANIGTVITPWMLFYQASAVVEKRLTVADLPMARLDTLIGSIVTQLVMSSVLITFAVQAKGIDLEKLPMGELFLRPLEPLLGRVCTQVLLTAGLLGSSLLASLVVCLGVAWNLAECSGSAVPAGQAMSSPYFRGFFVGTVIVSAVVVCSNLISIMRLNILVQLLNGALMPLVVCYVFLLATKQGVLPEEHRVRGLHAVVVAAVLTPCCWMAVQSAASAVFTAV